MIPDGLRTQLREQFAEAVAAVNEQGRSAHTDGLVPVSEYRYFFLEPKEKGRKSGEIKTQSEVDYFGFWQQSEGIITADERYKNLVVSCDALTSQYAVQSVMTGTLDGHSVAYALVQSYFRSSGKFEWLPDLADRVLNQCIADLISSRVIVETVFWVQRFSAPNEFELDNEALFRPVQVADLERFGRFLGDHPSFSNPWLAGDDWICVVTHRGDKATFDVINRHHEMVHEIAGALNLTKKGRATFRLVSNRINSDFFGAGNVRGGQDIPSSRLGDPVILESNDIVDFRKIYDAIRRVNRTQNAHKLRFPLSRMRDGASRLNDGDSLADHVIALESLLAPDSDRLEVTFRFRLRGAALLSEAFGAARERLDLMVELYNARSRIVHGDELKDGSALAQKAETVTRAILSKYLDDLDNMSNPRVVAERLDEQMVNS